MPKINIVISIIVLLSSCQSSPELWPINNTRQEAIFYELNIADTSNLFTKEDSNYKIIDCSNAIINKDDTIEYSNPGDEIGGIFKGITIQSAKRNRSNPKVIEYYCFDNGAVKLAGYSTGDSLTQYVRFSKPMVILPDIKALEDSSNSVKQNWNHVDHAFKDETKIRTQVKLAKTGTFIIDGKKEDFLLYQLTLIGDAMMNYGGKNLLVPDAIFMQTNLLYGKTKGLLYEWSIKSKRTSSDVLEPDQQQITNYIELIKYNPLTD